MKLLKILGVLFFLNILLVSCSSGDKQASPLQVTVWKPVKIFDQKIDAATRAEITFQEDLSVNGNGGVNRFVGRYNLNEPDGLAFSPLASTKMAALDTKVAAAEDNFFKALAQTKKYTLKGNKLTLLDDNGKPLVVLTPVCLDC